MRACSSASCLLLAAAAVFVQMQQSGAAALGIRRLSSAWFSRPRTEIENKRNSDSSWLLLKYSSIRGGASAAAAGSTSPPSSNTASTESGGAKGHCIGIDLGTTYRFVLTMKKMKRNFVYFVLTFF